ncbi:hypothetical protein FRB96_000127 [Tulasnella sp. 330]|nr:hypothetical protein FRB96_000127 [Tulasnella sp. 330]
MFMLKSLFGKVWSDPNTNELAKLTAGELYIVRPRSSVKGARECIFQNAMATVRRTSQEFNYQLVITRVYEEGEEETLDEDDETDDELQLLIDTALAFRSGTFDGLPTIAFRDPDGDEDDLYEFVAGVGVNAPTMTFFETAVLKAMYERKHQKSSEKARDADLKKLMWNGRTPRRTSDATHGRPGPAPTPSARETAINVLSNQMANSHLTPAAATPAPQRGSASQSSAPTSRRDTEDEQLYGRTELSEDAELLWFDYEQDAFAVQGIYKINIVKSLQRQFNYFLVAEEDEYKVLAHELTPDLNCKWSKKFLSFRWNFQPENTPITAWCVRFHDEEVYDRFRYEVNRCLWETANAISWDKAKKEDTTYAAETYKDQDVEMVDVEGEEEEEEDEVAEALSEDSGEEEEEPQTGRVRPGKARLEYVDPNDSDASSVDEEENKFYEGRNEHNSGMVVGHRTDRTFVLRGGRIGVFKHAKPGEVGVKHDMTVNQVKTLKGKAFNPKKMMLHDQDGAMVLMNPGDPHNLYKMDLTVGKVVEEWKVHDDIPVSHIAPDSKFAQGTAQQTFVGTSSNGLFRIDPRISGNKLVGDQFKQYVTKAAFSGVATTEAGHLAVASEKGDIRLFDTIGKIAKTALPALGDPIIGVDVTASGRWIVATCKTHLYVIDTLIGGGRFEGKLGFERAFPADSRPTPKRLQLKPEHVMYMGSEPSFTPARFNTGPDVNETSIITSSGQYIVAWDFLKVKKGILDKYEIRKYEDAVVQDDFRFANDQDIVVALKNNVLMANKKELKKPTRKSLGGPQLRSRVPESSEIVNTGGY